MMQTLMPTPCRRSFSEFGTSATTDSQSLQTLPCSRPVDRGLIIDVFVAEKWLEATVEKGRRWGFVGHEALEEVASLYKRCRVPDLMRRHGAVIQFDTQTRAGRSTILTATRPKGAANGNSAEGPAKGGLRDTRSWTRERGLVRYRSYAVAA
jgi:hypothetical protein